MKHFLKLITFMLLTSLLVACGGNAPQAGGGQEAPKEGTQEAPKEDTQEAPKEDTQEAPFRIAVVMPSAITDVAFSQSIWESLKAVQDEMGGESAIELAYSEGVFQVPDAAAALRDYADQGYDLVIGHGSQYGTSISEMAPDFPETSFAWGTATDTFDQPNIFAYQAEAQQGGYVNGVLAGMMTKSKVIGVTGPVEAGDAKLYVDGFITGVNTSNPEAKINVSYTGSFSDVALMTEAANTHIKAGADILTGSSQSVVGSVGAAKEAGGVYWFGTQADQTSLAPEVVVASQVYDWTGVIKDMIEKHKSGTLGGESYTLTFDNGGLKLVYNPKATVPDDVKAAAEDAIKGIEDGSINPLP